MTPLLGGTDKRPIHFMGIAGAGMSALAELFARRGARISGCDANPAQIDDLRKLGIDVLTGHDPAHVEGIRALVVTSAVPKDHPELERARAAGVEVIRRAEALGEAVSGGTLVAIAGTHGKTTTTVMTTEALAAAGRDPTGVVGGRVAAWGGNLRFGAHETFVVEADEYDRSFLALTPTVGVVTNVEADHLDIYKDLDDIRGAFATFLAPASTVVLCDDDAGAKSVVLPSGAQVIRYGLTSRDVRLGVKRGKQGGEAKDGAFVKPAPVEIMFDDERIAELSLQVPGDHNLRNALAAIGAGLALGTDPGRMVQGLATVRGAERRFERIGEARGVTIVDDYAHHPTEIRATLAAARGAFPKRRIIAAFQPHLFTRTRDFALDFASALDEADVVYLADIYPAREKPLPGVTSSLIADAMSHTPAWRGPRAEVTSALASAVKEGDVVITIGAGDITKSARELLDRLGAS